MFLMVRVLHHLERVAIFVNVMLVTDYLYIFLRQTVVRLVVSIAPLPIVTLTVCRKLIIDRFHVLACSVIMRILLLLHLLYLTKDSCALVPTTQRGTCAI